MRFVSAVGLVALLVTSSAFAERLTDPHTGKHVQVFPYRNRAATGTAGTANLGYHNGPVLHQAKVVPIFWGPSAIWGTNAAPSALVQTIVDFFVQFGTNPEYNVITEYYDFNGSIQPTNLTTTYWIDNSTPLKNVTDKALRNEVIKATGQVGLDAETVYEVFLPPTSFSSLYGLFDSCGGPFVYFCAYHNHFAYLGVDVKYASMPYPSCAGCQWPGWTDAQNLEHFACHETREAVTDPDGNAWRDWTGSEADDKCAWSPDPFLVDGYGYQYEWSNLARGCVQSR
jgi:hypothetical protein